MLSVNKFGLKLGLLRTIPPWWYAVPIDLIVFVLSNKRTSYRKQVEFELNSWSTETRSGP